MTNDKLRSAKVDQLTTQNQDLHGRRIVNAADGVDATDYVTKQQLESATKKSQDTFGFPTFFKKLSSFFEGIVVKTIRPFIDSTTAIQILNKALSSVIINVDTLNGHAQLGTTGPISTSTTRRIFTIKGISAAGVLELTQTATDADGAITGYIYFSDSNSIASEKRLVGIYGSTNGSTANNRGGRLAVICKSDNSNTLSECIRFEAAGGAAKVGFFGTATATKQTLNAYTTNAQNSAYVSTPISLATAATLSDLNALRLAYENLRLSYDDLRTKLQTTTLVG